MKIAAALMLTGLAFVRAASAQDCKSDDFSSFSNVKNSSVMDGVSQGDDRARQL